MEAQNEQNHREEERWDESYREVMGTEEQVVLCLFCCCFFFFGRINRQGGFSSDVEDMPVFKRDGSKSERAMALLEMW